MRAKGVKKANNEGAGKRCWLRGPSRAIKREGGKIGGLRGKEGKKEDKGNGGNTKSVSN